jgi:hypothetical protein
VVPEAKANGYMNLAIPLELEIEEAIWVDKMEIVGTLFPVHL